MLGNWPLGQLLTHLTRAVNNSIDGTSTKAPWLLRIVGPVIKGRLLKKGCPPVSSCPRTSKRASFPPRFQPQEALDGLRTAVGRLQREKMTARHPILGKLTHEEWTRLHLLHAELHPSFAVPGPEPLIPTS